MCFDSSYIIFVLQDQFALSPEEAIVAVQRLRGFQISKNPDVPGGTLTYLVQMVMRKLFTNTAATYSDFR
jgi:hypothetical protein